MTTPAPTPGTGPEHPSTGDGPVRPPSAVRDAFRRALRDVLVLVGVVTVVGAVVGYLVSGTAGLWGALLAAAVTLVFSGSTVLAMLLTARSSVTAASGALVGTWITKMLLLIIAFGLLRDMDFYDRGTFLVAVLVGVLGAVLLDYRAVAGMRVPYTEPGAGDGAGR
ncbi:hypothetical protein [Actinotalea soli]|uniref:hypothetical protein n=1 Tax=Actinotalea soli TaxID=2819234 RepID=UPI001FB773C2|nr:hypothetical protein [Actinotalea soli]